MFSLDPNSYNLNEQYRQDRLRDVERRRLIDIVKHKQPSRFSWKIWIGAVGTLLMKLGTIMQVHAIEAESQNTISRPVS